MPDPLHSVKRAAQAKRRAEKAYRSAVVAAREAGHSYPEIARAAGTSRQAIRQLLLRA